MSDTAHTGTVAEALATWIRVLIQAVGPETAIGFALSIVKRILQKAAQGLPGDRDDVLSIAGALKRTEGGR